jgi:hypothetical protein
MKMNTGEKVKAVQKIKKGKAKLKVKVSGPANAVGKMFKGPVVPPSDGING